MLNTDAYISTGHGMLGLNMFAYCNNNPVGYKDASGTNLSAALNVANSSVLEIENTINSFSNIYKSLLSLFAIDGPSVAGDTVAIVGMIVLTSTAIGIGLYKVYENRTTSNEESKCVAITTESQSSTIIYRYGGTSPGNLTPRLKDIGSGLSFSTIPKPGAAMTTIEAINATGVVTAVKDGPYHVSVRPVGASVEEWYNAGSSSIWTKAVRSVVVKWPG